MAVRAPNFTYQDLRQMPENGKRYELSDGALIVTPAPSTGHQGSSVRFVVFLFRAEEAGFGRVFDAPIDVYFDRHNVTQPDLIFISKDRLALIRKAYIDGAPDLIVELLSPSTRQHDLGWKMSLYAREGVRYYWITDPLARTIQPYVLDQDGYRAEPILRGQDVVSCPLFPGITTTVDWLFP